jgi:hypothetical protein
MAENLPILISFISEFTNSTDICSKNSTICSKLNHTDFIEKKSGALELVNLTKNNATLKEVWDSCVSKSPDDVAKIISESESSSCLLKTIDELKECSKISKFKMANESIKSYLQSNAIVIASQIYFLYTTLKELKEAENIIKNENLFDNIENNIIQLNQQLDEYRLIINDINESRNQSDNLANLSIKYNQAGMKSNNIILLYRNTMDLLNAVEIKIGSKIETLKLRHGDSVRGTVTNGIQTLLSARNVYRLWPDLSDWNRVLGLLSVATFGYLTYQHNQFRMLTTKRIAELRDKMEELETIKQRLSEIDQKIRNYNEELIHN